MEYVFDGKVVSKVAVVKSPPRNVLPQLLAVIQFAFVAVPRSVLPRLLAVILFAFAAVIGHPIAATVVISLLAGDMRSLALTVLASPLVLMCGWLGTVLWSGRAIPHGAVVAAMFIVSLAGFVCVLLAVAAQPLTSISLV